MGNQRFIAFALIIIGALALLSRFSNGGGWIWVGLVAAGFLAAYVSQRTYSFLVVGSILAGVAVGILLEGQWGWDGAFLISLGVSFVVLDQIETRSSRWPRFLGILLIVLGLVSGVIESGFLGSIWFALILIGAGVLLLSRRRSRDRSWVPVRPAGPPPADTVPQTAPEPEREEAATEAATEATEEFPRPPTPGPATEARLERLKAWRDAQAEEEGRSAYFIFNDEILHLLAETGPTTIEELKQVRGIGPVKLERYGTQLLELLRQD